MNTIIQQLSIDINQSLSSALKQMDSLQRKLLIVTKNNEFHSLLSIGDIQRAMIKGVRLSASITGILRGKVTLAKETDDIEQIKSHMLEHRNEYMPILSTDGEIVRILFWNDLFESDLRDVKKNIELPVVLMAGGIGSRLKPLTNVLPKALIPIGDKSIIEQIMDSFVIYNCREFFVSLNYKAEMIKYYLNSLPNSPYNLHYAEEKEPLGTAGSVRFFEGLINTTFFLSNCDIMIEQDYSQVLDYHNENKNEITIVAALVNYSIPYGVLNTDERGLLISMSEKPEYYYKINTGLYILEPTVFKDIPKDSFFNMTDLIQTLMNQGRKVGVFPVSENSWIDMGSWEEFLKKANVSKK